MMTLTEAQSLFPQLKRQVRGRRLVYLDSAATALKPRPVIEAVQAYMSQGAANVHRGAHLLSDEATEAYENVREAAARFVGASNKNEIVFTRGTTECLNLVAQGLARCWLQPGDEIIVSQMEHHANIVPWQMVARERGFVLRFVPVREDGSLDFEAYKMLLSPKTKVVSLTHLSNALGTCNPLREFFAAAHAVGAVTIADVAQSVVVYPLRAGDLGADFLAFSGHKVYGPTGVGVLYGRQEWLEKLPPYQGGGSMISEVREDGVEFLPPPHRFEAGTPPIAEVLGLGAALKFMLDVGHEALQAHERGIMQFAEAELSRIDGLKRYGQAPERSHVYSFLLTGAHPSDVGAILDEQGIAVRAGHHCCQPLMRRFGIPGTVRASFAVYTTEEDVRELVAGVRKAKDLLI